MKALVTKDKKGFPSYLDIQPKDRKKSNSSVVELKYSALNRRDHWITKGLYPGITSGVIMGSDGMGSFNDRRVVINPAIHWGSNSRVQSDDFHVLGLPQDGTFSAKVAVPYENIHDVPSHMTDIEASALPLAGLTAYRVLFSRCNLQSGDKILISGVGGGVAHFVLLFAVAHGANVTVTSSSNKKIEKAISLGASHGVNYKMDHWYTKCKSLAPEGFNVIIDSAAGDGFSHFIDLSAPGARIGIYGGTRGEIGSINPQVLFWRQISILGSTMGSPSDFSSMLHFVQKHRIKPVIDAVYPMSEYKKAFKRLAESEQFGKIVFDNEK